MLATERESLIREKVRTNGIVYVTDLIKELNVTAPTIRNDLDKLVKKYDDLDRIHGGVVFKKEKKEKSMAEMITGYGERSFENIALKKAIALKAMDIIENGDTLLIDSSSTCFELASLLSESDKRVTVITNGLSTGTILKQNPNLTVIIINGLLKPNSNTIYDEFDSPIYNMFNIDKYFFSASGLSIRSGFSEFNIMEVKNKKLNIEKSHISIALIDSTKFDKDSSSTFCELKDADYVISDNYLTEEQRLRYQKETNLWIGK